MVQATMPNRKRARFDKLGIVAGGLRGPAPGCNAPWDWPCANGHGPKNAGLAGGGGTGRNCSGFSHPGRGMGWTGNGRPCSKLVRMAGTPRLRARPRRVHARIRGSRPPPKNKGGIRAAKTKGIGQRGIYFCIGRLAHNGKPAGRVRGIERRLRGQPFGRAMPSNKPPLRPPLPRRAGGPRPPSWN